MTIKVETDVTQQSRIESATKFQERFSLVYAQWAKVRRAYFIMSETRKKSGKPVIDGIYWTQTLDEMFWTNDAVLERISTLPGRIQSGNLTSGFLITGAKETNAAFKLACATQFNRGKVDAGNGRASSPSLEWNDELERQFLEQCYADGYEGREQPSSSVAAALGSTEDPRLASDSYGRVYATTSPGTSLLFDPAAIPTAPGASNAAVPPPAPMPPLLVGVLAVCVTLVVLGILYAGYLGLEAWLGYVIQRDAEAFYNECKAKGASHEECVAALSEVKKLVEADAERKDHDPTNKMWEAAKWGAIAVGILGIGYLAWKFWPSGSAERTGGFRGLRGASEPRLLVAHENPAPPKATKEQRERAKALRARAKGERGMSDASFERSDTDGCVTQWCHDKNAELYNAQATILENGGYADFVGLYEGDRRVKARLVESQYGTSWMLDSSEFALIQKRGKKYLPHGKSSRILKSMGLSERKEAAPAWADYHRSGATGFSGLASLYVEVYRTGDKWGSDAILLDERRENPITYQGDY